MRKVIFTLLVTSIFFTFNMRYKLSESKFETEEKHEREFNDPERLKQEFLMLRDPVTNKIPDNIRSLELQFAERLPKRAEFVLLKGNEVKNVQSLSWLERGPNNIAGRVRALAIDTRTTGTPTILAGGASGGMWKSTDGGATWGKKSTSSQLHSVTCVAQDTRTGSEDVWYYGSGENIGNSAGGSFQDLNGNGIFKSTNNGDSWTHLASTGTADNTSLSNQWQYVFSVAVHPTSGNIYTATCGGFYKSADGGDTWTFTLDPGNGSLSLKTDLAIASDGTIYALTSSAGGNIAGIKKSTDDGASWTSANPTLPGTYERCLVRTAPSNANVVYVFMQGVSGDNSTPNANGHILWRTTDGGTNWSNISSVIPANTAPDLDNFSTQDGYDMILSVKPDDPNFIIIGGVSVFKIPDVTNDNQTLAQKHIGGYGMSTNGTANALGDFFNHHPDNHIGVFLPGSSDVFYMGNDGGVAYTNDITAAPSATFWQVPLRTGLNVSQFYCAALDKTSGSGFIAGGLQDRGSWMARTNGSLQSWQECGGGDGTWSEIDPTGTHVFMSTTHGNIYRFPKSVATAPVPAENRVAMTPSGANNQTAPFVTTFDLDDNDGNLMFTSGGDAAASKTSGFWRCNNATAESPTWTYFTNSAIEGQSVTALKLSKANSVNVLYYGTSNGKVFRLDNANTADPATATPTDVSSTSFPNGYVSSIAVDPVNSANVFITFSNYNVDRIWYSTNSGSSWTSITGNLTGANSPSVRSIITFKVANIPHYFIGTSTGVYFTIELNGSSTVWTQEAAASIGNVVVVGLDYRDADNTLIAATHGRGVFETQVSVPLPVELVSFTGTKSHGDVILKWQTATENNNFGFEIEHKTARDAWSKVGFIQGAGNSHLVRNYTFTHKKAFPAKTEYRLKQIDMDGKFKYSNTIMFDLTVPALFTLSQNYPNPFNPSTVIDFAIPAKSNVTLEVFDITGKKMMTLVDEEKEAGNYSVKYNASYLSSGIYFYRLSAGINTITKKMLLMR
ncbi:MAG: T9SS type A sorting domain-containing protein [Ignavibacteriales bacterium]|nr:T9SS type A sorting domain-containing protein [Ignavibacteriales bacterium]